jgi:DNA polymerase-3 subunit epsilon
MAAPWTSLPLLAIDCESTGVDPFTARIVELAAAEVHPDGTVANPWRTVVNPGIDIPTEAAEIHGITTERARAEGIDPTDALAQLGDLIWQHVTAHQGHAALVMFNGRYDWPLILTEAERHGATIPCFASILDPYLIDRRVDQYRRGKRKLTLVAEHYKVELGDAAHGALADATAAGQVMWQIVARHPDELVDRSLASLWLWQVKGHEEDRTSFQDWMRRNVDPKFLAIPGWPVPIRQEIHKASTGQRSGHQTANDPDADPVLAQDGGPTGSATGGPPTATDFVPMSETENRRVHALIAKARPGQDRHTVMTQILGRPISSAKELSTVDADRIVDALDRPPAAGRGGDAA